jgi:hypothetical protein
MNLTNRPILPKQPKIKNSQLIQHYRSQHKQCELCALDGEYQVVDDIHHIIPNHGRSDEIWNIIALCRKCHIDCTEHINGDRAYRRNVLILSLKYLKGEITQKKLQQLDLFNIVETGAELLEPRFRKYKRGEL